MTTVQNHAPITYHQDHAFRAIEAGTRMRLVNPQTLPKGSAILWCYERSNRKDWRGREWSIVERPDGDLLVVLRAGLRRVQ